MKPEYSNDALIHDNERNVPHRNDSGEFDEPKSSLVKNHFTDSEQRSSSFDDHTKDQAQRAPLAENEATFFMHSIHEFDQDSMLHFETDDIVSRKSKEPVNFLHTTNDKNQINTQGFEKKSTNYEPYIATFEDSNEKDEATYYCPTFNNITSYKGYPTTTSSERILSRLDQSSNQNCTDSSASGQKNDAVYTTSTSNKPYQHLTHKNLGGGSDNTAFIFDSADDSQSLQDLRTSLKNSSPSASENHKPNRGHASFTARKSLRLDEDPVLEAQESKMSYTPLKDRSDSSYDNMRITDSTQIHGVNVNPSIATEKRNQTLQANYGQPCSCNSRTNYRIVKVSPIKVTHCPYDVPTRSQSLLDQAIQATPDSTNSEISNQRTTGFKNKPTKPHPSYNPYDVLTLGQTVMKDATESSLQKNGVIHNAYDVPTKAQSLLQEAATSPSLKDKVTSSYNALTNSILSIPIETPPSPEDSDDELLVESGASDDVPEFKERLPLTYALDASNRAFSHINNGYPPSPKAEKQDTIDEISVLDDNPPSVNIQLESIEGNTIGVEDSKNDMSYLSDKMPGSYDFFDMRPIAPEPVLYDSLPISCISEKEEPAIHGQCACYTATDIVQPESLSFRYVSKSSRMNDIEPSIHGQSPSFYPGEKPKSSIEKFPVTRTFESKVHDKTIQGDKFNKRRDMLSKYHGHQGALEEIHRPLQQYEKVKPTGEKFDVSDMSMAIPVPETIDVDDFSFKIQKPEDRDRDNEELAYNEVLLPVEFDEDKVDEIHPEQVETVKVKNSFFKKVSLTPQQALRFYNNHSTLIDLALATNPVSAAFVVAKDVNQQRVTNKKARAEREAEMAAHPERFIQEEKPKLSFTERLKNAPKSAVKVMNENQGYINAALAASPGGKVLDAARLTNRYARRGVDSYTHAATIHSDGFKKAGEKFAFDNLKSYTDPFIPKMSVPKSFHGFNADSINSYIPGHGTKMMNTESDIPMSESPLVFDHTEYFMGSEVNKNGSSSSTNNRTLSSGVLSPIPQEDSTSAESSKLPYMANPFSRKNSKIRRATTDSVATTRDNGQTSEPIMDPIIENRSSTLKTVTESTSTEYGGNITNSPEPNRKEHGSRTKSFTDPATTRKDKNIRVITDPATMKTYTLYNQPCRRNYSETNLKKTVNFYESKNTYQKRNSKATNSKQKKPKLHARPYSTPTMKDTLVKEESPYNPGDLSVNNNVREIPMKRSSVFVPIEAFDNASFTSYISGHFENRKGSFQKTMGRLVQNDKMKDNGDRMKLEGKTKIKVYQFKRKSIS